MAPSADFLAFLTDQLRGLGTITTRRMFSGAGLYCDGLIFALILRDTLYFKVDDGNRQAYEAEGLEPFTLRGQGQKSAHRRLLAGPRAAVRRARRDARLGARCAGSCTARAREEKAESKKQARPLVTRCHLPLPVAKAPKLRHRSDCVVFRSERGDRDETSDWHVGACSDFERPHRFRRNRYCSANAQERRNPQFCRRCQPAELRLPRGDDVRDDPPGHPALFAAPEDRRRALP